ncbi:uncharacterized protein LOC132555052 [Ylistrum balloti]|uniref:uncharacterized protein LOC132555052 n=1 Tax=Ylistrum balloti TaxID=509963 RepID=UPI0029059F8A|nr:uncharacterized protein LOC132555052 [Ylistrum balloti]
MERKAWFFLVLLYVGIHTNNCQNYISFNYQTDKSLSQPFFLNFTIPDMFSCFSLCQQIIKCGSVSFDTSNKVCEMNAKNSTSGSVTASSGYLFTDVTSSTTFAGGCADSNCEDTDICILDQDGNKSGCASTI